MNEPSAEASPSRGPRPSRASVPRWLDVAAGWAWRLLLIAAALIGAWWALSRVLIVVLPLVFATIFAAALAPVVDRACSRMSRTLATTVTCVLALAAVLATLTIAIAPLVDDLDDLVDDLDGVIADTREWLVDGPVGIDRDTIDDVEQRLRDQAAEVSRAPFQEAEGIARGLGALVLTLVATFFLLRDGPSIWTWILRRIRPDRRPVVDEGGRAMITTLRSWVLASLLNGMIEAVSFGIVLVLVGAPAAVPLTILTFFAPFFPIIGATVVGIVAIALTLAANGPADAVIVAVSALVIQQVEGNVLLPVIMRRAVRLHPIVTLFALSVGAALGGILGALLAVPLAAATTSAMAAGRQKAAELGPPPTGPPITAV